MKNKIMVGIALIVALFAVLAVGDSTLRWSNPDSANGTFILDGVVVSNSTVTGGNGTASFSNLTVTTTVTLPAGSVGADDIAAGTMANKMTISNANNVVYASNLTTVAGGAVSVLGTTASSSKDTGAVVVEGGVGVEEDVYAGGQIQATGAIGAGTTLSVGSTNVVTYIGTSVTAGTNALRGDIADGIDIAGALTATTLAVGGTNVNAQITTEVTAGTNALRGDIADGIDIAGALTATTLAVGGTNLNAQISSQAAATLLSATNAAVNNPTVLYLNTVRSTALPTTSAGLSAGDMYEDQTDGSTVKIYR